VPGTPPRYRVTAILARGPGLPAGDTSATLEMEVCLDANAALAAPKGCGPAGTARRTWPDREPWSGELVPLDGRWGLRGVGEGDDAPVWELQGRVMRPGEYVTLVRPTDEESVFRVVNVEAAERAEG